MRDILVGVSGASGMPLAVSLMRLLAAMPQVRTHCVVSDGARAVLKAECGADAHVVRRPPRPVGRQSTVMAGPSEAVLRRWGRI